MNLPTIPIDYRPAETARIFAYLSSGDSCQIVGIGSSGKSNLLRFLNMEEARRRYLGSDFDRFLFVYIDANKLLQRDDWGFYELALHQMLVELEGSRAENSLVSALEELHRRACDPATQHMALRYLDRALALVCKGAGRSVVLLLDEFDDLARCLPPNVFSALRAFRDEHKYNLMYLTAARRPLSELRDDEEEIEAFTELLSGSIVWLNALNEADARVMVERMAARQERGGLQTPGEQEIGWILRLTGCHPGLLRGVMRVFARGAVVTEEGLTGEPVIIDECRQIWRSLPIAEQRVLAQLAADDKTLPELATWQRIVEKGLVREGEIFSPVFRQFILREQPAAGALIEIDTQRQEVWVLGKRAPRLTPAEFCCLEYLWRRQGEVCKPEAIQRFTETGDMAQAEQTSQLPGGNKVYRGQVEAVIKRLRQKIEPVPSEPRLILTVRGRGYRLETGERS